jgi:hypothetical protein
MVLAISRERHPLATARCAEWCGMTRKVKPPRVMWAVYSTDDNGGFYWEAYGHTKKEAIQQAVWQSGPWSELKKAGYIVVKYVVAP